jgi:hypothetical protein
LKVGFLVVGNFVEVVYDGLPVLDLAEKLIVALWRPLTDFQRVSTKQWLQNQVLSR